MPTAFDDPCRQRVGRRAETAQQGLHSPEKGKPDPTPARAEKRTASRFCQLKFGHALTGVYLKSAENRQDDHCWWCDPKNDSGTCQTVQALIQVEGPAGRDVGGGQ